MKLLDTGSRLKAEAGIEVRIEDVRLRQVLKEVFNTIQKNIRVSKLLI